MNIDRSNHLHKKTPNLYLTVLIAFAILASCIFNPDITSAAPNLGQDTSMVAPRSIEEQRVIDIYKHANEAVAFITTISLGFDVFEGLQPEEGTGSGVVIDAKRGIILTNFHVIQGAKRVEVALAGHGTFEARLVGIDPLSDLAVLKIPIPPEGLSSVEFGDSSTLEVGQNVIAIGNPFGLNRTLTTGSVSSLARMIRRPDGTLMRGLIQTDASINVGNSGGPLLDMAGRLIGINTAILSRSGDSAGIGFAVPINQIKRVLPELIATGKVLRPEVGWVLVDTDQGPMVHQIFAGSPASLAQVRPILRRVDGVFVGGYIRDVKNADLIYKVNGKIVHTKDEVDDIVAQVGPGKAIEFELLRGGRDGKSRLVRIKPEYK